MSLTAQLKDKRSPVRAFMDRELGVTKAVCKQANLILRGGHAGGPPVPPTDGAEAGLVGLATEFAFASLGGMLRRPHLAGASTAELALQRAEASDLALRELQRQLGGGQPNRTALGRAADCALICARLEQHYRVGPVYATTAGLPDPATGVSEGLDGVIRATEATKQTRADLSHLLSVVLQDASDLYRGQIVHVNPVFGLSVALGGADADVIADGGLIDFKASKDRSVIRSVDIFQLLGYALADVNDEYGIHSVGIHAIRWRTRWTIPLPGLLAELSGLERPLAEWRERFRRLFPSELRMSASQRVARRPQAIPGPSTARGATEDLSSPRTSRPITSRSHGSPTPAARGTPRAQPLVERLRRDLQHRLEELDDEADRVRRALAALNR